MEKKTYVKPELEVVEFAVEAGFAQSYNGGALPPSEDCEETNAFGDNYGWDSGW